MARRRGARDDLPFDPDRLPLRGRALIGEGLREEVAVHEVPRRDVHGEPEVAQRLAARHPARHVRDAGRAMVKASENSIAAPVLELAVERDHRRGVVADPRGGARLSRLIPAREEPPLPPGDRGPEVGRRGVALPGERGRDALRRRVRGKDASPDRRRLAEELDRLFPGTARLDEGGALRVGPEAGVLRAEEEGPRELPSRFDVRRRLRRLLVAVDRLVDARRGRPGAGPPFVPPRPGAVRGGDDRVRSDEEKVAAGVGNGRRLEGEEE